METLRIAAVSWGGLIGGEAIEGRLHRTLDFRFERAPDTPPSATAAGAFMNFWETLVIAALLGYVFSWFATIGTRLFLAMRLLVDQQSTSVVWVPGAVPGSTVGVPGDRITSSVPRTTSAREQVSRLGPRRGRTVEPHAATGPADDASLNRHFSFDAPVRGLP